MSWSRTIRARQADDQGDERPPSTPPFIDLRAIVQAALIAVVTYAAVSRAQSPEKIEAKLQDHGQRLSSLETLAREQAKVNERILNILERRYGR